MRAFGGLAVAAVATAGLAAAAVPWRLDGSTVERAVDRQLTVALGFAARIDGPVTLKLLPRPRLRIAQVSATGSGGAVLVDVPEVKAELDIASLIRGRWRLASATLVEPTVTVDADRVGNPALSADGRSARPASSPLRLKTRGGVLRTVSANPAADAVLTDIDAALAWPGDGGAISTSGTLAWRGRPARFAARIEHLSDLAAPSGSAASLQIASPSLTLSADGVLSGGPRRRFAGHLAAFVPSLPSLFGTAAATDRPGAGRMQVAGDIVASDHGLSFSDASFRIDRGRFEGTLAIRRDDQRTSIEGTLATDVLDVDGLLADDAGENGLAAVSQRPLGPGTFGTDVDLRVSATRLQAGRLAFTDAALAVLLRGQRLEVSLDEAGICGGRLKGRAVARLGPDGAVAHAEANASRVDIAALSAALGGDGQVGGTLTGDAVLDGAGHNLREIVAALGGHGEVSVDKGRLAGLSLGRTLTRFGAKLPLGGARGERPTVFDRAVWAFSVDRGVLKIPDGRLTAPGVAMSFSGETRLPDGRVDIAGTAVETDAAGALVAGSPRLPFTMRGSWDGSLVLVGHAGGGGLRSLVLPLVGAPPPSP